MSFQVMYNMYIVGDVFNNMLGKLTYMIIPGFVFLVFRNSLKRHLYPCGLYFVYIDNLS